MTRVSLLELMQSRSCDHSAESTAQRLLQHMSHIMAGSIKDMSHLVRGSHDYHMTPSLRHHVLQSIKLPTEFLMSLQTDEDLQKSVVTVSSVLSSMRI